MFTIMSFKTENGKTMSYRGIKLHLNRQILFIAICTFAILFSAASLLSTKLSNTVKAKIQSQAIEDCEDSLHTSFLAIKEEFNEITKEFSILADFSEHHIDGNHIDQDSITKIFNTIIPQKYKSIDQIRLIDYNGKETLRINYDDTSLHICSPDELQDKSKSEYFLEGSKLAYGDIYITRADLNKEFYKIEIPHKPVIRLITPLKDKMNNINYLLVLNYKISNIFNHITYQEKILSPAKIELLNSNGYWMRSTINWQKEWSFMFPDQPQHSFAMESPKIWNTIRNNKQGKIITDNNILLYNTIEWKVLLSKRLGINNNMPKRNYATPWIVKVTLPLDQLYEKQNANSLLNIFGPNNKLNFLIKTLAIAFISYLLASLIYSKNILEKHKRYEQYKNEIILSSCPAAILAFKEDKIIFSNDYIETIFGCIADEIPTETIHIITALDTFNDSDNDFSVDESLIKVRDKDGTLKELQCRFCHTKQDYTIYFINDLTDIKQKEKQLLQLNEELNNYSKNLKQMAENNKILAKQAMDSDNAKSMYLATISHEIRTPLTAILGYTDLSLKMASDYPEIKHNLSIIQSNSGFLLNIINTLLDQEKIRSGKMQLNVREMSIVETLFRATSIVQTLSDEKRIDLTTDYKPLPTTIKSDPLRIQQCITNLLGNAVKFTPKYGKISISAYLTEHVNSYDLNIAISDSGIGISKEKQKCIFEPFEQADLDTDSKFASTGLGLSITKQIVTLLGGTISVESEPDQGSIFTISLPVEKSQDLDIQDSYKQIEKINKESHLDIETRFVGNILIVDDTHTNLSLFRTMLQSIGLTVDTADNGSEAIEMVKHNTSYDLVLLDLHMPDVSGFEAYKKIKELRNDLNIIALTADALPETISKCNQVGFDGIIFKPINRIQMNIQLSKYLQKEAEYAKTIENTNFEDSDDIKSIIDPMATMKQLNIKMLDYIKAVKMSYDDINRLKQELDLAINNEDREAIRQAAHAMKNTAGTLSMKKVYEKAKAMEMKVVKEDTDGFETANTELSNAVNEVLEYISNRYINK